jgi:hypothetical protein
VAEGFTGAKVGGSRKLAGGAFAWAAGFTPHEERHARRSVLHLLYAGEFARRARFAAIAAWASSRRFRRTRPIC